MLRRVWYASIAYFAVFFALGLDRYAAHRSAEDLGIFYQTIASAFGCFCNTIEGANHLTVHFSPILFLLAPLVLAAHSAWPLIAVSAAANATVAPALFLIARRRTSERNASFIACVALVYPPLCGVTFADFHENSLVPATILWLLYALDARKYRLAMPCALVALAIKEDEALFLLTICAAAFWRARRTGDLAGARWSAAVALTSAAVFAGYFGFIRPLLGAHGAWHPAVFYTQTLPSANVGPLRALADRLGYLVLALAPLAFLPLRSRVMVLALAPFAEVLLSRAPVTYTMGQHYAAVWIPYVLVAYALAASELANGRPTIARRTVGAAYALCALVFLVANPLHPRYFLRWPDARDARLDRFIASLPAGIDLGTQEEAYTHMGFFPNATLGMEEYPRYALFDWEYPDSNWIVRDGPRIRAAVRAGDYRVVRRDGGIALYERIGPKPPEALHASPAW
ncbi:MAG: DUF2079 domain-containing protein [Candidatus Eremiobacteraeota bacterium]|nr:DUF2079 domain-containing protein [Candidatus Eremiobacteraeota bacterium]